MWAEKKALRRFVFIYLFSTLILIGFGEWFYYQKRIFTLRESQIHKIESQIKLFLANNKKAFHKCIFLNKCDEIKPSFDMAILKNKKIVYKNFDFKEVLKKRYKIKDGYIYYLFNIPKKDLPIEILARSRVDKSGIKKLWHELIIFNLFVVVFLLFMAFYLGKLFIRPLKEVIENLESFIKDATHEMNTPLSLILNNIEMLELYGVDKKEFKRIKSAAKRLEKIFKDLAFIKLYKNKVEELEDILLDNLILERIEVLEFIAENRGLKVKKELNRVYIKANREDMIRLIDNILSNAFKYAPKGSLVEIHLTNALFKVVNEANIRGIESLSNKFYREDSSEGGFGLGLYIVKKIVDLYKFKMILNYRGGKIEVGFIFGKKTLKMG